MRFKIIIPMYNASEVISGNIQRLKEQSVTDFDCLLVDDGSTDQTVDVVRTEIAGDSRFSLHVNTARYYALGNAVRGIQMMDPPGEDVIVPVDADDLLAHEGVLARLAEIYTDRECWLTYGSYESLEGERGCECSPYPDSVVSSGSYRTAPWRATHLKTFRAGLWKHIQPDAFTATQQEVGVAMRSALVSGRFRAWWHWRHLSPQDITDPSQRYFRRCYDKAIMFPMLEMARAHAKHVPETLYLYRKVNPEMPYAGGREEAKWRTRLIQSILALKPTYEPLSAL